MKQMGETIVRRKADPSIFETVIFFQFILVPVSTRVPNPFNISLLRQMTGK